MPLTTLVRLDAWPARRRTASTSPRTCTDNPAGSHACRCAPTVDHSDLRLDRRHRGRPRALVRAHLRRAGADPDHAVPAIVAWLARPAAGRRSTPTCRSARGATPPPRVAVMAESTPTCGAPQTLAELGHAGASLADAVVADGDLLAALAASHEARRLRAELARAPAPADGRPTTATSRRFGALVEGRRSRRRSSTPGASPGAAAAGRAGDDARSASRAWSTTCCPRPGTWCAICMVLVGPASSARSSTCSTISARPG
jgi:hypothetical protein